jgi:hypothetical protein
MIVFVVLKYYLNILKLHYLYPVRSVSQKINALALVGWEGVGMRVKPSWRCTMKNIIFITLESISIFTIKL